MSYIRVIPRDLFNEANLFKCLAQLEILTDNPNINARVEIRRGFEWDGFGVRQYQMDGSIEANNVMVYVGRYSYVHHFRPLNSRQPWPLYVRIEQDDIEVFTDDGKLSPAFLELCNG